MSDPALVSMQVVNESLRLDWLQPRRTPQGVVESHVGSRARDGTMAIWFTDPWRALKGRQSAQLQARRSSARPPLTREHLARALLSLTVSSAAPMSLQCCFYTASLPWCDT